MPFLAKTSLVPAAGAPGGSRTPNLLIRSQMLYPLSYRRRGPMLPRAPRGKPHRIALAIEAAADATSIPSTIARKRVGSILAASRSPTSSPTTIAG
jgi:hypothetical protein